MDKNVKHYLNKFYDSLYDNLERNSKIKHNSIILSTLETPPAKNKVYTVLSNSSKTSAKIPTDIVDTLLLEGLIQDTDKINTYTITAKGIWVTEKDKGALDDEYLISTIGKKYFTIETKPINEKEKVILFAMIAARTFSDKSCIDLKKDSSTIDAWKDIVDKACDKLLLLGVISEKTRNDLYGKAGNEHVVQGLFRRNTDLQRKVKGIYQVSGTKKYWLNLYDESDFSQNELSYLFWVIFDGNLSGESRDEIINFCNEISNDKCIFVFDIHKHIFSNPQYNIIIKDCLIDSIVSKNKWERRS